MSTKLICPDCGGVLGEADEGEAPCICFKDEFKAAAKAAERSSDSRHGESRQGDSRQGDSRQGESRRGDSQVSHSGDVSDTLSDTHPVDGITKVCLRCGCDVRGRKRYKDSRGYMCSECSDKEIAAEREGTTKCQSCGRRVKYAALTNYSGKLICKLCQNDGKESDKKRFKVVSSKHFDEESIKTLYIMLGVLAFLGLLILISIYRIMRHGV